MTSDSENHETDLSKLPKEAIIRINDVLRLYPVSKSHWWQGIKDGVYPKPIELGLRARGWRIGDVLALADINDSND